MNRGYRVFHIEDNDDDALLIRRAVERSHHSCTFTQFPNARAAIAALNTIMAPETEAPHLILSDFNMPEMNGLEFVRWLRQSRFSAIPVIILSSSTRPGDVLAAYRSGANSFTTKPLNVLQLNETIGTVLKYWRDATVTPTVAWGHGAPFSGN